MPTKSTFFRALMFACCAAAATLTPVGGAQAKKSFHTLYTFKGGQDDGGHPQAGVIIDRKGNLYGTTLNGPGNDDGTVFKIARNGSQVVLHSFIQRDGAFPRGGVIADAAGNLYGTTYSGGKRGCEDDRGCGIVFKLAPDGTETILHNFAPRDDGRHPYAGLVMDSAGNLYGTTSTGGGRGCNTACGTVFKVAPDGTETILHVFGQQGDGSTPLAGLILDKAGNLYGTAGNVAFKLAPAGTETILHFFKGGTDGQSPVAPLIADAEGNLYGTTTFGGGGPCLSGSGCGTIFKLAPDGTETVLYAFKGGDDGFMPQAGLLMDTAGNLLGTTSAGGGTGCDNGWGCGTVFKLAPDGTETVLHAFVKPEKGSVPLGSLVVDKKGRLFGTTSDGGTYGQGIVFKITSY